MVKLWLILALMLASGQARAVFMDCLFFDGFEDSGTTPVGSPVTQAAALSALQIHNCARKTVIPAASPAIPILTWNSTVATAAQNWANQCMFAHGDLGGFGQNIYAAAGFTPTLSDAAVAWAGEEPYYDYPNNTCNTADPPNTAGTCGHYTQVVWRSTMTVGCGFQACSTNSPFADFPNWDVIVCDYNPPGNNGSRPY
ncbi:MAG: CAP domain-containing protein [Rudaea sp.]|nr:CAP domain-containing protein [Rudaea sp.]